MCSSIEQVLSDIEACDQCRQHGLKEFRKFPRDAHGTEQSGIALVSEAPSKDSLDAGRYWTGSSGRDLREAVAPIGRSLEEIVYLTDVVKCLPPPRGKRGRRHPRRAVVRACQHFLEEELQTLQARAIIAVGGVAARVLLGRRRPVKVENEHGRHFDVNDRRVWVLRHPSNLNRSPHRDTWADDVLRVMAEAQAYTGERHR